MSSDRPTEAEAKDAAHPLQSSMSSNFPKVKDALLLQRSSPIYFHEDTLLEILSWLPAKTVRRLTFLSRSICHLYTDRLLRKLQTHRARTNSGFFVQGFAFQSCKEFFLNDSSGVPMESLEFIFKKSKSIVASSSGLIVFRNNGSSKSLQGDLCVFNPVLQTFAPIFSPPDISLDDKSRIGAICMSSDDGEEYEMILVTLKNDNWKTILECRRYSSRDMSWEYLKAIDDSGPRNINLENPVFVNGSMYWASDNGCYMRNVDPYILAFDAEKRSSKLVSLPEEVRNMEIDTYDIQIAPWADESLCLIQYVGLKVMVIWVMEPHTSQTSWRKTHELDMMTLGLNKEQQIVDSYTVINGELLVFSMEYSIYTYGLKDGRVTKLGEHKQGRYPQLKPYANTFHSCGKSEVKIAVEKFIST